jgi:hypothetical protein
MVTFGEFESNKDKKKKQRQAYHAMVDRNIKIFRANTHGGGAGRGGLDKTDSIMPNVSKIL